MDQMNQINQTNQTMKLPGFVSFISSPAGRGLRVAAGIGLMAYGAAQKNRFGSAMAALGLVPFVAGAADICLLGPALGGPLKGSEMRRQLHAQQGYPQLGNEPATWLHS